MKISLYKVLKISFIVGLLVVGLSDPQPTVDVQFDPDLSPGSVPAVDVPAQPGPVPVWGGDGAGQHSRPPPSLSVLTTRQSKEKLE